MVAALSGPERVTMAISGTAGPTGSGSTPRQGLVLTVDDSGRRSEIAEGVAPGVAYAHPEAHTITRWVGDYADSVVPGCSTFEAREPGLLMLCTDGLWNYFGDLERLGALGPAPPPRRWGPHDS